MSKALGQPMVIENRPGGGSIIGMDAVAKAAPDGYTLVMTDTSIAVNPSLKPLPYDTLKDFEPVSLLATAPVILVAHPKVPAKTLQEFVALAKAQPGKFNYASGGNGASTISAASCSSSWPASMSCTCPTADSAKPEKFN